MPIDQYNMSITKTIRNIIQIVEIGIEMIKIVKKYQENDFTRCKQRWNCGKEVTKTVETFWKYFWKWWEISSK